LVRLFLMTSTMAALILAVALLHYEKPTIRHHRTPKIAHNFRSCLT
jgi:hypothetical protein